MHSANAHTCRTHRRCRNTSQTRWGARNPSSTTRICNPGLRKGNACLTHPVPASRSRRAHAPHAFTHGTCQWQSRRCSSHFWVQRPLHARAPKTLSRNSKLPRWWRETEGESLMYLLLLDNLHVRGHHVALEGRVELLERLSNVHKRAKRERARAKKSES